MDGGTPTISCDDGARIVVPHSGDYEAWTTTGPDGLLIVCTPSGDLAASSEMGHDESNQQSTGTAPGTSVGQARK